jgi:hypothetical protein
MGSKRTIVAMALALGVALAACGGTEPVDPIEGEWESKDKVAGKRNQLMLLNTTGALSGEATVYAYLTIEGYQVKAEFRFDADASMRREGRYRVDLRASKLCFPELSKCFTTDLGDYDTELDCRLDSLGDELECDGDGAFASYEFTWRKM